MSKRFLCLMLVLIIAVFANTEVYAAKKSFIKEYNYQASEADSLVSCRVIALEQTKHLLLEEVGTYLESYTEVKNFYLTKDQITIYTAGITKTEIINENWDGKTYRLKAKIEADPDSLARSIDSLRKDYQKTRDLEEINKRIEGLLNEINQLKQEKGTEKNADERAKEYTALVDNLDAFGWVMKGDMVLFNIWEYQNALKILGKEQNEPITELYKEALAYYGKAIKLDPKNTDGYGKRGYVYYKMGRYQQAIADYDESINIKPGNSESFYYRGEAYAKLYDYQRAIQDFTKALELRPQGDFKIYSSRADSFREIKSYSNAINDYTMTIRLIPDFLRGLKWRDSFLKSNDYETMVNQLMGREYFKRGMSYGACDEHQKAIADFNKTLSLNPTELPDWVYMFRAKAYANLNNYDQAIEDYTAAININPGIVEAYEARGKLFYFKNRKYRQAIADFTKVIELKPMEPKTYYARGVAYFTIGDYNKSIQDCTKIIQIDKDNAYAFDLRGLAYSKLGNNKKFIEDQKAAARLGLKSSQELLKNKGVKW